ncbi:MAG: nucleoside monophosphate kinase [Patescibacteria group bacterium]|nr:nucleoside monophosphate kinase [Patescibacteria group bacterium]MDE2116681.1 nucleoside monophosphate kinase [Patescibacteria group bacterium]
MAAPYTVLFFGKSGAGKGTQAALLIKTFERLDSTKRTIYVETGQRFRSFVDTSGSYMARRIKEVMVAGKFLPPFIPIWTWTQFFVDEIKTGDENMVFDGVCRQPEEAPVLDSALQFLGRGKPVVILLDIHHDKVTKRLLERGRFDDTKERIAERLRSFEKEAMVVINLLKASPNVRFVTIDGDQTIEKVHEDILKTLGVSGRI